MVPTPSLPDGSFDPSNVMTALDDCHAANSGPDKHIAVIVSTLSPGACDELARLHETNTFSVIYNPTFIALGSVVIDLLGPDTILIGGNDEIAKTVVSKIWRNLTVCPHIHYGSFTEIELLKLSVNAALGTKISMANSLGRLFEAYGVSSSAVPVIGHDRRIGIDFLSPGSPYTGPCIPRDQAALQAAGKKVGVSLPISEATEEVQANVYELLVTDIVSSSPQTVGILGMSYKYGVPVDTAAVGPFLHDLLIKSGISVSTFDRDLPSGDFSAVLECDVIVVTLPEYSKLVRDSNKRVINLWA